MNKPVDFSTYQQLRKMSFNDVNKWVISIYQSGVQDGINITNDDVIAELDEDQLLEIMLSVKGIGKNRALQVIEKIIDAGMIYSEGNH